MDRMVLILREDFIFLLPVFIIICFKNKLCVRYEYFHTILSLNVVSYTVVTFGRCRLDAERLGVDSGLLLQVKERKIVLLGINI